MCFIYRLIDPITNEVMYIGKTNNPAQRYANHVSTGKNPKLYPSGVTVWINYLLKKELSPLIDIVSICEEINWESCEMFWISYYRVLNPNLTNRSNGGKKTNLKKVTN